MFAINKVFLGGRLTRDLELRFTPTGMAIGQTAIAVDNYVGKDEKGGRKYNTLFIDIVLFGKKAEALVDYLKKGVPIVIEGELRFRSWEDTQGQKRSKHEVIVNNVTFPPKIKEGAELETEYTEPPGSDEDIPF